MSKSSEADNKHVDFQDRQIFTAATLLLFILLTQVQMQCFISMRILLVCIFIMHLVHISVYITSTIFDDLRITTPNNIFSLTFSPKFLFCSGRWAHPVA